MTAESIISRDELRDLVGKMLFGSDLISELTKEQKLLLAADFGPKRKTVFRSSVMVNTIDVFEKPCPPERREDFDIALGRRERMQIQGASIDDWIETFAGLDLRATVFRRSVLDEAMKDYQKNVATSATVKPRGDRGPEPTERNRVIAAMKADITHGKVTLEQLRGFGREANASTYSTSSGTARDALKQIVSEFQSAETLTNSDSRR
jgi:hypothetical protein